MQKHKLRQGLIVILHFCFITGFSAAQAPATKKIIYYGWDTPAPAEVVDQGPRLEASPFDAVVFKHSGARQIFTHAPLPDAPFQKDISALQVIESDKLSESFLRMQINAEDGWSWASESDWAAFASNLRNYARLAREGGLQGILFDPEPYGFNVWNYETQAAGESMTFEEMEAVAKERGAEFVTILKEAYPGVTIFSLKMFESRAFLLADDPDEVTVRQRVKDDSFHGLWYGFANGMVSALDEDVRLIDGNERSYYYLDAGAFGTGREEIYGKLSDAFLDDANQATFQEQVPLAHAAYMDGMLNLFNSPRFIGYYFADEAGRFEFLAHNLYHGLKDSDEYFWLYVEDIRWWENENVPEGLLELIRRIKTAVNAGEDLSFDTDLIARAREGYEARVRVGGQIAPNAANLKFKVTGAPDTACNAFNNGSRYTCTFPAGSTVTVAPVADGLTFEPAARSYETISVDNMPQRPFRQDYESISP